MTSTFPARGLGSGLHTLSTKWGWAVGLGANVLVGGTNKGFALQPISIQGFNGINIAAGVAEMELHPVS